MNLLLTKGEYFSFDFFIKIEEESVFANIPFKKKTELLEKALENLDNDVIKLSEEVSSSVHLDYFTKFTYDIHRDDGIKGTVADYYIIEIVKYFLSRFKIEQLIIDYPISRDLLYRLNKLIQTKVKITASDILKRFIRFQFGALKYIYSYLHQALLLGVENNKIPSDKVFFLTGDSFNIGRYKDFPKFFSQKKEVYFINLSLSKLKNFSNNTEFRIKSFSIGTFVLSLFKTFGVYYSLNITLSRLDYKSIYSQNLKKQSFLQTYYLLLRRQGLKRVFKTYKPKYAVALTTVGDPLKRMFLAMARTEGVKTINYSCRSVLSYMRSEDRVLPIDFDESKNCFFVDYFVIFDKISKNHLIKAGVNKGTIFNDNILDNSIPEEVTNYSDGFLILLAHQKYNDKIIDLLKLMKNEGVNISHIYYREHPSVKITKLQLAALKDIYPFCMSLTGVKWSYLKFTNVIALSSNSTSGIDASERGASIVWLPFLTEHSAQFKPMMNAIGETFYKVSPFINFLNQLENNDFNKNFHDSCNSQFKENIYEESTIDELMIKI